MTKLRRLHGVLGVLCVAFAALIVLGNTALHTPPGGLGYFKRGDVAALLGLGAVLAIVLFWSSAGDTDRRRAIGSIASGTMTGLLLGTVSIPVLAVPLSIIGCFRLPESQAPRIALLVLAPLGAVVGSAALSRALTRRRVTSARRSRESFSPTSRFVRIAGVLYSHAYRHRVGMSRDEAGRVGTANADNVRKHSKLLRFAKVARHLENR